MSEDYIDRFLAEWSAVRPEIAARESAGLLRVLRIAARLDRELAQLAARHGLKPGQFQVLAALRRLDPQPLSPKGLMESAILTSGAVTPVLDRLEVAGLVRRQADPNDRRGVRVTLTGEGRRRIDAALDDRMARHKELLAGLSKDERLALADLTRKVLLELERVD